MAERFKAGDTVVLVDPTTEFGHRVGELFTIQEADPDDGYLLEDAGGDFYWVDEASVDPVPPLITHTVPAPPTFSSPEEADAWLEAQQAPRPPVMIQVPEGTDTSKLWVVTVQAPDGTVELQSGVLVMPGAPSPVRSALSYALAVIPT